MSPTCHQFRQWHKQRVQKRAFLKRSAFFVEKILKNKNHTYYMERFNNERSANYRCNFFKANKGLRGHRKHYHCSYCGRIKKKDDITVDHLIPVNKVLKGCHKRFWKMVLRLNGINDINDTRNLVPACRKCNSRKGANTGIWIIRGLIGRHFGFWCIEKPVKWLLIVIFAYWLYTDPKELTDGINYVFSGILNSLLR